MEDRKRKILCSELYDEIETALVIVEEEGNRGWEEPPGEIGASLFREKEMKETGFYLRKALSWAKKIKYNY